MSLVIKTGTLLLCLGRMDIIHSHRMDIIHSQRNPIHGKEEEEEKSPRSKILVIHLYDITPSHIILATGKLVLAFVKDSERILINNQFEYFCLTQFGIQPGTAQTLREWSVTKLPVL